MSKLIDLTGQRFNRLLILRRGKTKNRSVYWECECDCGVVKEIRGQEIRSGETKSCGCLRSSSRTCSLPRLPRFRVRVKGKFAGVNSPAWKGGCDAWHHKEAIEKMGLLGPGKRGISKYGDVHHIDGDITNNDVSNLEVLSKSEHGRIHATSKWGYSLGNK